MDLSNITSAQFLNEPAWRWVVFLVMLMLFLIVWRGIVQYMKG